MARPRHSGPVSSWTGQGPNLHMRAGVEVKASYWPALLVIPGPLIPKVALSVDLRNMEWPQSSQ